MFSVIMPVYNGEKFIEDAVNSVCAQTYDNWELIIVNDGSKDNTADVLKKYEINSQIKIIHQENGGVSVARNTAISASKGEYIVFLDADDVWHTNHLEVMNELITEYPDAGLYATFTRTELVNGGIIEECNFFKDKPDVVYLEDFFKAYYNDKSAMIFNITTACFSRKALDVTGLFPVGCAIGEDLELALRVAAYFPVVLSKKATGTYKKTNSTATKDISFDPDWKFFDTVNNLYSDSRIGSEKKENLKKIMQWFTMRKVRHLVICGRRKEAFSAYRDIGNDPKLLKDKLITLAILLMPVFMARKLFEVRWRGRA